MEPNKQCPPCLGQPFTRKASERILRPGIQAPCTTQAFKDIMLQGLCQHPQASHPGHARRPLPISQAQPATRALPLARGIDQAAVQVPPPHIAHDVTQALSCMRSRARALRPVQQARRAPAWAGSSSRGELHRAPGGSAAAALTLSRSAPARAGPARAAAARAGAASSS